MNKKIISFAFIFGFFLSVTEAQVSISTEFFGQNAWWIDITASDPSTSISAANWTAMAASGVKYVRIGGIALNFQPLYTFTGTSIATISKLTNVIDKIRSNGMKPIIEVGFKPDNICTSMSPFLATNLATQATIAGNLVTAIQNYYANLSQPTVKYWIIANEPDNFLTNCTTPNGGYGPPYDNSTPGQGAPAIATYIQAFSKAMKDADNTITIIGPEVGFGNDNTTPWRGNTLMIDLMSDPTTNPTKSIMGKISSTGAGNLKYFIDVISFHYYPNTNGNPPASRVDVIANPTNCIDGFRNDLSTSCSGKKAIVQMIPTAYGRSISNLKIACTEFNLPNTTATAGLNKYESTDFTGMIEGDYGNRSFIGGQWMSEVLCEGMNASSGGVGWVQFMNPWSVRAADCTTGRGYISACNDQKRPTYWHYQMVANNFSGTYYSNSHTYTNYKAFAYKNASEIGVLIMNQDQQNPRGTDNSTQAFTINFNNTPGSSGMDFAFPCSLSVTYSGCSIQKETSMLLKFNLSGAFQSSQTYSLQDALRGASDVGPNTYAGGTETVNSSSVYTSDRSNNAKIYSIITIGGAAITPSTVGNNTFQFTTSATIDGSSGAFSFCL